MILCIFILFFMIIIISQKKSDKMYNLNTTICYKGILVLLVIMCHTFDNAYMFGNIAVSIFFFMSGYGLKYKYDHNGKIEFKKIMEIYIPFCIVNTYYILKNLIFLNPLQIILSFLDCNVTPYGWYIIMIIFLYLIFKFIYLLNIKYKDFIIMTIVSLLVPVLYMLHFNSWWYVSLFGFNIGIIAYLIKDKKFHISYILSLLLLMLITIFTTINNVREGLVFGIIMIINSILASITYLLYGREYELNNNILSILGKYSLTMYLFHPVILSIISIDNSFLRFIIATFLSLILSFIYSKIKLYISKITDKVFKTRKMIH